MSKVVTKNILVEFWEKAKNWVTDKITDIVTTRIAEIVANAPDDLNTLKEIADWITEHKSDAAEMNSGILANKKALALKADVTHTHTQI